MDSSKCENIPDGDCKATDEGEKQEEGDSPVMGSVFEGVIQSLQDLKEHMTRVIIDHVVQGFRMLSKPYKKEK